MNDLMREEFETWVKTFNSMPAAIFKDHAGRYTNDWIQARWVGWQASRESLVVKLPKARDYYGGSSECLEGYDIDEVVDAIEAAGVKTK